MWLQPGVPTWNCSEPVCQLPGITIQELPEISMALLCQHAMRTWPPRMLGACLALIVQSLS